MLSKKISAFLLAGVMAVTSFASQPCYARPVSDSQIINKKTIYLKLDKDKSKPLSIAEFRFDFSQIIGHIGDCTNGPYPRDAIHSPTYHRIKYDGMPKAKKIKISTQAQNEILTIGSKPRFEYIKGDPFCSYEMAYTENGNPSSSCFSRACLKFLRKRYAGRTVRFRVTSHDAFDDIQYSENIYTVNGKRVYPNRAQSMEGRYNGHRMKHKMVHHKAFSFPVCDPDPIKANDALADKYGDDCGYNDGSGYHCQMIFGSSRKFGNKLVKLGSRDTMDDNTHISAPVFTAKIKDIVPADMLAESDYCDGTTTAASYGGNSHILILIDK